jgi:hypothetical protein
VVERLPVKQNVAGSIPAFSAIHSEIKMELPAFLRRAPKGTTLASQLEKKEPLLKAPVYQTVYDHETNSIRSIETAKLLSKPAPVQVVEEEPDPLLSIATDMVIGEILADIGSLGSDPGDGGTSMIDAGGGDFGGGGSSGDFS